MTPQVVACAVSAVLILSLVSLVCCYPYGNSWSTFPGSVASGAYVDECRTNGDVETLCQTCAVHSKSDIVYPMCCTGAEEARSWCERYIAYGVNHHD